MSNNTSFLRPVSEGTVHGTARRDPPRPHDLGVGRRDARRPRPAVRDVARHDRGARSRAEMSVITANKVKVGFFSFTEITDPAEHRSYNEWHQLDHMPEQYPVAGHCVRATVGVDTRVPSRARGQRGRARPDPLRDAVPHDRAGRRDLARLPAARARAARSRSLPPPPARALVGSVRASGHRRGAAVAISAAAVPYRPNRGVYVTVHDARDGSRSTAPRAARTPAWPARGRSRATTGGSRLRGSTTIRWRPRRPLAPASTDGVLFAGPFETITPWQWDWFDSLNQSPAGSVYARHARDGLGVDQRGRSGRARVRRVRERRHREDLGAENDGRGVDHDCEATGHRDDRGDVPQHPQADEGGRSLRRQRARSSARSARGRAIPSAVAPIPSARFSSSFRKRRW